MAEEEEEDGKARLTFDPFEVVASDGAVFKFTSPIELREFIAAASKSWGWLKGAHNALNDPSAHKLVDLRTALVSTSNHVSAQSDLDASSVDQMQRTAAQFLAFAPALHSRSALSGALDRLKTSDPAAAFVALAYLMREAGVVNAVTINQAAVSSVVEGHVFAVNWMRGDRTKDDDDARTQQAQTLVHQLGELRDAATGVHDTVLAKYESISALLSKAESETQRVISEARKEFDGSAAANAEDWRRITSVYEDKLGLSAPSRYWQIKGTQYKNRAIGWGIASGTIAVLGLIALGFAFRDLFGDSTVSSAPKWWTLIFAAVLLIVFLWTIKTTMRLTMSHVHMSLDADERRTMIVSYLAMSRKSESSQIDRTALFAAIFRPSGDGIVKDETPPFPIWELLKGTKPP